MMNEKKNIERLFQEKFKDFEETPPAQVWDSINASLDKKASNKKKVIPIWWKLGGVAAALVLLFVAGSVYLNSTQTNIPTSTPITDTEQTKTESSAEKEIIVNNKEVVKTITSEKEANSQTVEGTQKDQVASTNSSVAKNTISNDVYASKDKTTNKILSENTSAVTQNNTPEFSEKVDNNNAIVATEKEIPSEENNSNKKSILDVVEEMNAEETVAFTEKTKVNRWSISPNVAPVYYNSLSKGSPISNDFASNSKEGKVNMSYGINLAYNVSNRLSIRSGVSNVNMSYNTNSVSYSPAIFGVSNRISTIDFNKTATSLNVASTESSPTMSANNDFQAKAEETSTASMQQELGYIEVPMELKYRLVDKRFGVNIIGGFSSLFLTNNVVSLQSDELATDLGEANNINDVNFSTNIGLGVDYQVSNKLLFNLEPMFKYQLNTFSREDGGFSPYLLGVYTGLSFRF
ncbi:outer membrane beta-barrel protein [Joostella sp. CR20]|uniref:outer membrane beta-barrel protein n=1 Tax=Joostella sp. CR20 TaxID=2804312 RepID=UPI00313EF084